MTKEGKLHADVRLSSKDVMTERRKLTSGGGGGGGERRMFYLE